MLNNISFETFTQVSYKESLAFGKNQENRKINPSHLQKLKKQWLKYSDMMPAVIINSVTNNIIDGQHRIKAYQMLIADGELPMSTKLKVMYVNIPLDTEKEAIIDANTNSKNWSLDDYIASYVKAGVMPYVKLEEWCKTHSLCFDGKPKYRYGAAMLTGKHCQQPLKNATFDFDIDNLKIGEEIHTELLEIVDLLGLKNYGSWIESLSVTWYQYRNMHPFRVWLGEMKNKKARLIKMPKDNASEWEAIFNTVHGAIDKKNKR